MYSSVCSLLIVLKRMYFCQNISKIFSIFLITVVTSVNYLYMIILLHKTEWKCNNTCLFMSFEIYITRTCSGVKRAQSSFYKSMQQFFLQKENKRKTILSENTFTVHFMSTYVQFLLYRILECSKLMLFELFNK